MTDDQPTPEEADDERGRFGPYTSCRGVTEDGTVCEADLTTPKRQQNGRCRAHEGFSVMHADSFDGEFDEDLRDVLRDDVGLPGEAAFALSTLGRTPRQVYERIEGREVINLTTPGRPDLPGTLYREAALRELERRLRSYLDERGPR